MKVIALHGWLDNAASWTPLLQLHDAIDSFALDFAGHGWSDHRPQWSHYHFIDNVADVLAVADALGWKKFGLLGHSLGASVATLVAGTVPDRITSLVCVEGFGPLTTPAEQAPQQLQKSIVRYNDSKGIVRRFSSLQEATAVRARSTGLSDTAAKLLTERGTCRQGEDFVWRSDPRLLYDSPMRLTENQAIAYISRITAPSLLIRGEDGLEYLQKVYAKRAAACRQLQVEVLPGGHHLHLEQSTCKAVADSIMTFHRSCQSA